jgi:hypothetical protein
LLAGLDDAGKARRDGEAVGVRRVHRLGDVQRDGRPDQAEQLERSHR